jgi:aspartyl-tRNA(Asn)/glutamyl-tRNA(Gln) amidotransferase subunit A
MTDLTALTVAEARDALRDRSICAAELTEAHIAAIEAARPLNAFVHDSFDLARRQAEGAQRRLDAGMSPDLCGIPLGIKDLFCMEGVPTQAASRILEGFRPPYESTVTRQLRKAGAVTLGKLNMDEFAMGSSNETSVYGPAINPWRRKGDDTPLTPGGSSGGSAAAVAAGSVL